MFDVVKHRLSFREQKACSVKKLWMVSQPNITMVTNVYIYKALVFKTCFFWGVFGYPVDILRTNVCNQRKIDLILLFSLK